MDEASCFRPSHRQAGEGAALGAGSFRLCEPIPDQAVILSFQHLLVARELVGTSSAGLCALGLGALLWWRASPERPLTPCQRRSAGRGPGPGAECRTPNRGLGTHAASAARKARAEAR